jgi:glycosyltransferase involved in cell wall biosynthesis
MRVVEVIATLDGAGAERQMALLAARLDRARFEPRVLAITRGGPVEADLRAAGVPVEVLGKRRKIAPGTFLRLAARLRKARPHAVHTHLFTANAYGRAAALFAGVPAIVATEHATDPGKRPWQRAIDRALARESGAIVCASEAIRKACEARGLPAKKLVRIYNGVDAAAIAAQGRGLSAEPGLVVTACRLEKEKDVPTLVRAIAALRGRGVAARLAIAGEGSERAAIEAEAASLGVREAIELLGWRADMGRILARGAVFALASKTEGFGVAIAEAMAAGRAVVASRVEGIRELVEDGRTGLLVPPGDAAAFAGAIGALLADPARAAAMGEAGRERARAAFSVEAMVRAYESLFEMLARCCKIWT